MNIRKKNFKKYEGFLWILPALILLLIFSYYPPLAAIYYSLTDWDGARASFIGLDNFIRLFKDPIFYKSVGNMFILLLTGIVLGNIMTIILAELLYNLKNEKISGFYRFLFILPILVPGIVMLLLWERVVLSPEPSGIANTILRFFNINKKSWYHAENTVLLSIILTNFPWVAGTSFLIYLAGLQNIPKSVIEASKLDGITLLKRIRYIDLPYISGQIKYFIILGFIGGIQNYNLQYAITRGGPNNASQVPGYYMYNQAFNYSDFGYASAIGTVLFIVILVITIINNKYIKTTELN